MCCGFHPLTSFEGARRTCRARLAAHNDRRKRKRKEVAEWGTSEYVCSPRATATVDKTSKRRQSGRLVRGGTSAETAAASSEGTDSANTLNRIEDTIQNVSVQLPRTPPSGYTTDCKPAHSACASPSGVRSTDTTSMAFLTTNQQHTYFNHLDGHGNNVERWVAPKGPLPLPIMHAFINPAAFTYQAAAPRQSQPGHERHDSIDPDISTIVAFAGELGLLDDDYLGIGNGGAHVENKKDDGSQDDER